jgi:hypothetical protein
VRANKSYASPTTGYFPAVLDDGTTTASFQKGFPTMAPIEIPSTGIITNPDKSQSYVYINPDFKNPHVISWNLAVQRQLPWHLALDVAYVGNHGVNNVMTYNVNAATVAGKGTAGQPQFAALGRTASSTVYFNGYSSMYNGLQMKLDRRFATGLTMTTAYTWGRGMSFQTGDDGGPMWYIGFRRNYARTDFDRRHTFVQSYVYDLPFGKGQKWLNSGLASKTIGGWRVNGILTLMTGTPMTIGASGTALAAPGNSQTADQIAAVTYPKGINTGNEWFSRASFSAPTATGVFGNSGRNIISGPGFYNLDFSLFKIFALTEKIKAELRAEAFSATNTPQFSNPGTTVGNANFGYVTGAGGGRGMQLGFKVNF